MKTLCRIVLLALLAPGLGAAEDPLDRVDDALSWSSAGGQARARVSGLADLEGYLLPDPAPGVIYAEGDRLFVPRLTVFLDAQLGASVYAFAQARADRGFDPANQPARARLDEYALRWSFADAHVSVQAGKFATIVGNWTARHDSWTNPFITAPLPYENLTGVWDSEPARSAGQLLLWSHVRPGLPPSVVEDEKSLRVPIVWGPGYATGLAAVGDWAPFRVAAEVKSAGLSSRPEVWGHDDSLTDRPAVNLRVSWRPSPEWEYGWSAGSAPYLRPSAAGLIPRGATRGDYREDVLVQDLAFSWHHVQAWAEVYAARFAAPGIGHADTLAYYLEAKYKFSPRLFGGIRWNQQVYGTLPDRGRDVTWGHNVWRLDVGPGFRFTPHTQVKVQYSVQRGDTRDNRLTHLLAVQSTLRF